MAVGVDEHGAVGAPKGLSRLAPDRRAGCTGVESARPPAPTRAVFNTAVPRELGAVPEGQHHVAGLEEDHIVLGVRAALPAERLVEATRSREIAYTQSDRGISLSHGGSLPNPVDRCAAPASHPQRFPSP